MQAVCNIQSYLNLTLHEKCDVSVHREIIYKVCADKEKRCQQQQKLQWKLKQITPITQVSTSSGVAVRDVLRWLYFVCFVYFFLLLFLLLLKHYVQ